MGMGSAASVLVGHAIGQGDAAHARRVAASALLCGIAFMAGFTEPMGNILLSYLQGFLREHARVFRE